MAWKRVLLAIVLLPFLAIMIWTTSCYLRTRPKAFDATVWRTGDRYERGRMTWYFRTQGPLLGLSRQEVLDLLGPTEENDDKTLYYKTNVCDFFTRTIGFDWNEFLVIELDPNTGSVHKVDVYD